MSSIVQVLEAIDNVIPGNVNWLTETGTAGVVEKKPEPGSASIANYYEL